jgi:lipopolysaccharide biosynthesis glycosyltransferase
MIFTLCATKNMYPQLSVVLKMLINTQQNIDKIYCFTEGDFKFFPNDKIEEIRVDNFEKIKNNKINGNSHWTYMILTRCYFTELLPNVDKLIYLDLDIWIQDNLQELWDLDLSNYAFAAVPEIKELGYGNHPQIFYDTLPFYCNSGVMVMNLKFIREHKLDEKIQYHLENFHLLFPDQDAMNIGCNGYILPLDGIWNYNNITKHNGDPKILHIIGGLKPWNPAHPMFPYWCSYYFDRELY